MGAYENDRAFEHVLQNTGNIDKFLDEFFSFLARRTDFFVVSKNEDAKVGFPPGVAAKLIISKYKKWESFRSPQNSAALDVENVPVDHEETVSSHEKSETDKPKSDISTAKKPVSAVSPSSSTKDSTKTKKPFATEFNSHNGRKSDKYSWSQSIKELDVFVVIGPDVKTKRDVQVEISMHKIRILVPSQADPVVIDWTLPDPIIKDESYWSLHPGEAILLCLQKAKEKWWDHLFEGEEVLDRNQIEAVRPMEELGEEDQAKIHELVWNEEQKMKGLPTSEELKLQEVMKKAWNVDGSPFKGQPFDPSLVQLANNSINFSNPPTN